MLTFIMQEELILKIFMILKALEFNALQDAVLAAAENAQLEPRIIQFKKNVNCSWLKMAWSDTQVIGKQNTHGLKTHLWLETIIMLHFLCCKAQSGDYLKIDLMQKLIKVKWLLYVRRSFNEKICKNRKWEWEY